MSTVQDLADELSAVDPDDFNLARGIRFELINALCADHGRSLFWAAAVVSLLDRNDFNVERAISAQERI